MTHLGARVSALVDGELSHEDRDRALSHVAHCTECRAALDAERSVKEALATLTPATPSPALLASLQSLALPGGPVPPRAKSMPQGPVVPLLPAPGRAPRGARGDSRRPAHQGALRRSRTRARYAAVGALSVAGLVLGTAFVAGGSGQGVPPVAPPAAELSVEHSATTAGFTVGDPGLGLASTFGDFTGPAPVRR
jgi:hypothetical protein